MKFEWNDGKATRNVAKHGVSFAEAASVFWDPLALTFFDPDHSSEEDREITIGLSALQGVLFVAHTVRGDTVRIISSRKATRSERKQYEEGGGIWQSER
jgi:uncharacterized DUF497 family protein